MGAFSGALFTEAGTFSSLAEQDLFVARLNHSNGLLSWVKRFGGSGDDSISALKSEGSLIYLAGGVKKIGSKAYSFLFEIDQNGIALKSYSLKGSHENQIADIEVDGGRIFLLGSFDTSIDFAGKTLSSSGSSAFVLSMKTGLIEEWASLLATQ